MPLKVWLGVDLDHLTYLLMTLLEFPQFVNCGWLTEYK